MMPESSHPEISGLDPIAMFMNVTKDTETLVQCTLIPSQTQNMPGDYSLSHSNRNPDFSLKLKANKCGDNNDNKCDETPNNNLLNNDIILILDNDDYNNNMLNNNLNNHIPHLGNDIILDHSDFNNNMQNGAKPEFGKTQGYFCSNIHCWSLSNPISLQSYMVGSCAPWIQMKTESTSVGQLIFELQASVESHNLLHLPTPSTTELDFGRENIITRRTLNDYDNYHIHISHNYRYNNDNYCNYNNSILDICYCISHNNNNYNCNTYFSNYYLEPYSARLNTGSTPVGSCSNKLPLTFTNFGSFQLTNVHNCYERPPLPRSPFNHNHNHNHNNSINNIFNNNCYGYTNFNYCNYNNTILNICNNNSYRYNNDNYCNYNNSILDICNNNSHRYINWNRNNNTYCRHNNINNIKHNSRNISNKEMHTINGNIAQKLSLIHI